LCPVLLCCLCFVCGSVVGPQPAGCCSVHWHVHWVVKAFDLSDRVCLNAFRYLASARPAESCMPKYLTGGTGRRTAFSTSLQPKASNKHTRCNTIALFVSVWDTLVPGMRLAPSRICCAP
jgi:hypothetical protein